jgi:hypothetical protein
VRRPKQQGSRPVALLAVLFLQELLWQWVLAMRQLPGQIQLGLEKALPSELVLQVQGLR